MTKPQPQAPSPKPVLILASSSPRRRELLQEAGYNFIVMPPEADVECGVCSESGPAGLVAELAYRKAAAIREKLVTESPTLPLSHSPTLILAADTVAECDGFILGKPRDESDANAMLNQLSSRDHRVLTGVCLWELPLPPGKGRGEGALRPRKNSSSPGRGGPIIRVAVTKLRMDPLSQAQLEEYLASGQWEGKAGAFGYQDRLGWVHVIEGSESNVVGLPMELLAEMLAEVAGGMGQGAGSAT
ncbi:MAG TPA: Maf family protein [Lacipirellulaceae bacterium]|nr:Maf family protein [Lacipirellulaceae bacterium]